MPQLTFNPGLMLTDFWTTHGFCLILQKLNLFHCFVCWKGEKVLSFVPPDGNYRLLSYHITAGYVIFLYSIAYFYRRKF